MTASAKRHWADKYKGYKLGTYEWWLFRTACATKCLVGKEKEHKDRCEQIATYAFMNDCCIWHANWATSNKSVPCSCANCGS